MAVANINEMSEKQRKHFNNIEKKYEKAVNDPKAKYYRRLVYKQFFGGTPLDVMLKSSKPIAVLEAMCGDGMGLRVLKTLYKNSKFEYEGFDYSDEMVKCAKIKYPQFNFFLQDVNKFHSEKKYDVIILLSGLHHVPNTAHTVMKRMKSYLKEDGYIVSVEPTYNSLILGGIGDFVYKYSKFYDYDSERRFSLKYLNNIFYDAGYKIEKQFYPGLLAYLLWWFNPYPLLLKLGNESFVKKLYLFEKKLYSNWFGKHFSLATFTILKKV